MPKKNPAKRPTSPFALTPRQTAIVQNWESTYALAPKITAVIEDCSMTVVYDRLARGEYRAVKDGVRTKVTTESIKERRAKLAPAQYKPQPLRVDA